MNHTTLLLKRIPVAITFLFIIFCRPELAAQDTDQDANKVSPALPITDIYLLDISLDKKGKLQFQNPALITKNENYDDQPWWYPDGSGILYASVHDSSARDSSKADIYKYDMRSQKTSVVINTPRTAEYSPMIPPNKIGISVVQVLEDDTTQFLCRCDNATDECTSLLPKQKKVAYYVWIDASRVAFVVLSDPWMLLMANLTTGKIDTLAEDVGRCLQKVPGKNLQIAFVDKVSNPWTIKTYDGKGGKISGVVPTLEEQEDFCYMPDGSLLMGSGSQLFRYVPPMATPTTAHGAPVTSKNAPSNSKNTPSKPEKPKEEKGKKKDHGPWEMVADFKNTPLYQFYRLAASPKGDKLAIVTYLDEKP